MGFAFVGTTVGRFVVEGNGGALTLVVAVEGFDVDGFGVGTVFFAGVDEEGREGADDSFTRSESATCARSLGMGCWLALRSAYRMRSS